jgi:inositol transport system ATP-binding protein
MSDELLLVEGVRKQFPGVTALDGVSLRVARGEVHALLGENGAGKSTLLKILSGAQRADQGQLRFDGCSLGASDTPVQRIRLGIVTIYQELNLLPALSVAENIYLGREPLFAGFLSWRRLYARAQAIIDALGLDLDPRTEVRRLSVAQQQMVEIARALTLDARLIVMDEPTSALSGREVATLHRIIRELKAKGISVVYVTHRLREVKEICDRYTVLRDGELVACGDMADVEVPDLVRFMVGREVELRGRRDHAAPGQPGPVVLQVENVCRAGLASEPHATVLRDLSVDVRAGEIVGFAGLVGAGRTELARVIFGADRCDSGAIRVSGTQLTLRSPGEGIGAGIVLVPEDRKQQGCFLTQSIRQNMTLPSLGRLSRWKYFIDEKAETALVEEYRRKLRIKMGSDAVAIATLSGGNQQKVLLARSMALSPKVLIVDEPTRGIDVGAKAEVHQVLFAMAAAGVAVIVISSELPEVMAVSDRIVTFHEGRITGVVQARGATEEQLMRLMTLTGDEHRPPAWPEASGATWQETRTGT